MGHQAKCKVKVDHIEGSQLMFRFGSSQWQGNISRSQWQCIVSQTLDLCETHLFLECGASDRRIGEEGVNQCMDSFIMPHGSQVIDLAIHAT